MCRCVWFQNIDGIVMARQYDTAKVNEYYRPIPVHSSQAVNNRHRGGGVPPAGGKPYVSMSQESTPPPRYEADYDYKTTHYPSYPPNYPYDDAKYKYAGGGGVVEGGGAPMPAAAPSYGYDAKPAPAGGYAAYDAGAQAAVGYDARGYAPAPAPAAAPAPPAAAPATGYPEDYTRYGYDERQAAYAPIDNHHHHHHHHHHQDKYYGYDARQQAAAAAYEHEAASGRYAVAPEARYDGRYADARGVADGREADARYEAERRYDGREAEYVKEHEAARYHDARELDGRYDSTARYPAKENYYDRYYKHRPSRDHHSESSRY